MAHRLVQSTSTIDTPVAPDTGTWNNKANIRDSGDPPVVDGTNVPYTDITVSTAGPVSGAIQVHSPTTLSPGVLLIGMEVDWEVTGASGGASLTVQASGEPFPTSIFFGSAPAARQRFRYLFTTAGRNVGNKDVPVKFVAGAGSGFITVRIYEVGYWITERVRHTRVEG